MRYLWASLTIALLVFLTIEYSQAATIALDKLRASTVHIDMGSGSIVQGKSGRKYLLTNWHVCLPSEFEGKVQAAFESGVSVRGDIVKMNAQADLCAINIDDQSLPALKLAPKPPSGAIHSRGYPNGVLSESSGVIKTPAIKYGYDFPIEDLGKCPLGFEEMYSPRSKRLRGCHATFENALTTLYGRPGSSGSPVVDDNGDIVGVIESQMQGQGAGMVPYRFLRAFLESL